MTLGLNIEKYNLYIMFKKYNSIENSYQEEFLGKIKGHDLWDQLYIVQEKVHGANLSFFTKDGVHFEAAKRTEKIPEGEQFYNYKSILEALQTKFKNIWNGLKNERPDMEQMTIFGEVIGGDYPHPDVLPDKAAIKVQKGIYYSPHNHFFAFDIMINAEKCLDVSEANRYFVQEGLLHAKTLFEGHLSECLTFPNEFNTTIPDELGLPTLVPNLCEGVVIRPLKTSYFNSGKRVMLKNKNEKWSENRKYHKSIKKDEPLSEQIIKLQEAILTYTTENRLNNVISKIGEVTEKDFGKVLGMFSKDIVEDFLKDYHEVTEDLDKKELKIIKKSMNKTASELVKIRLRSE